MHKTRFVLFSLAAIIGILFSAKVFFGFKNKSNPPQTILPMVSLFPSIAVTPSLSPAQTISNPKFNSIKIAENDLSVETVSTPDEIQLGLSGRKEIGSDGMLFMINPPRQISFWMKDMFFPIDIIWISGSKISGIEKNVPMPPADITDDKLHLYNSPSPVDYVLELPAGMASKLKIDLSSQILIPLLPSR